MINIREDGTFVLMDQRTSDKQVLELLKTEVANMLLASSCLSVVILRLQAPLPGESHFDLSPSRHSERQYRLRI
jgi:hypothetical protein